MELSSASWDEAAGQEVRAQWRKVRWICMWHFRIWRHSCWEAAAEMDPGIVLICSRFPGGVVSVYSTQLIALLTFLHANAFLEHLFRFLTI